jgi:hypothetical protein
MREQCSIELAFTKWNYIFSFLYFLRFFFNLKCWVFLLKRSVSKRGIQRCQTQSRTFLITEFALLNQNLICFPSDVHKGLKWHCGAKVSGWFWRAFISRRQSVRGFTIRHWLEVIITAESPHSAYQACIWKFLVPQQSLIYQTVN